MIKVTRLNNVPLILNSDLIEHVDATPDTVVTLVSGQKYMVQESPEEIVDRVTAFRRSLLRGHQTQSIVPSPTKLVATLPRGDRRVNG